MLTIRLARSGAKKRPFYHISVADSRMPRDGRFVERVGYYNPIASGQEVRLEVNLERIDYWISKGAQPSDRVLNLLKQNKETPEQTEKRLAVKEAKRVKKLALKAAAKQADPKILEPIMKLTVITPEENMGDVIGDLNRRRGQVEGMDDKGGAKVVNAKVPLSEMFGYITDLRTITSGRATSTMEFFNFVEAPRNISDEVIKKVKGE